MTGRPHLAELRARRARAAITQAIADHRDGRQLAGRARSVDALEQLELAALHLHRQAARR